MILVVSLSPCIDVNIEVDSLSPGMTHPVISKRVYFTGKAINIAIGIARLKGDVFTTGFMYEENSNQFEHELHKEGVPYKFIWNPGRVRENYKFIDNKSMLTEFNDVSLPVTPEKQQSLIDLIKKISPKCEAVIISGSLAKGMSPDYYAKVLNAVPNNLLKIIDAEGERLFESLKCGLDLVKPNLQELESTLKRKIESKEDMIKGCNQLIDMGAKRVLLSLGKQGAIITDGDKIYYSKSVNVAMNSTIGAGDGMVAGASYALTRSGSLRDILLCGVAAGTAAVTSPHSISFSKDKYTEVLSGLTIKEL